MATLLSAIETQARRHLLEQASSFWSSPELLDLTVAGIRDLWRDIVDLKAEHFLTIDNSNVTLPASSYTLSGVPTDVHKVYLIEGRGTTPLTFKPANYNDEVFQNARVQDPIDVSSGGTIYYSITQAGGPVGAVQIYIAPRISSARDVSFVYNQTLGAFTSGSTNPIPGESDQALIAWTVAFARAKEREDRSPDASWLAVYATEKQHLLQSLGLRQVQEPEFVGGLFEEYW